MRTTPLRLLLIEDFEDDALLVLRELRRGGYAVTHTLVETAGEFERALDAGPWDVIIADYALPAFDALAAFHRVRQRGLDVPFLIVSGQMGEDAAVAAMKAGVHDLVLKERLGRLSPAVERELREAALRAERRMMQEQLLLSDRLASLGMLAASVAHEINNPLTSLMANLDFLLHPEEVAGVPGRAVTLSSEQEQVLRDCLLCAERIREIVRDTKVFSRPEDKQRVPLDVHRVLDSSLRMAWNHIVHRARVVKDYAARAPVLANEAQLGQVFLNLLVNAAQAIPEVASGEQEIRVVTRQEDGHVRVEIHDTGAGIPAELRERIFEPFFTTKPVGEGTGLGLAICRRLVNELGGELGLESEPGQGTRFHLRLPAAAEAASPEPGSLLEEFPARRVLVLDDELIVGRAIERLLGMRCEVVVLDRAAEALAQVSAGRRFDVILCDLMMPGLSGPGFYEELQRQVPTQAERVIFMTGGAFTEPSRAFLAHVGRPCLDKPLDVRALRGLMTALAPLEERSVRGSRS